MVLLLPEQTEKLLRVDGQLGDFRVDPIHARNRGRILAGALVDLAQNIAGASIRFADQKKVRIVEIADHRS